MGARETFSRREVLSGRVACSISAEAHVSSLVVHVRPENADCVSEALGAMSGVEIPLRTETKLIVTLETDGEAEIVARLNEISLIEGVLSAALVFHHFEPAAEPADAQGV